MVAACALRRCVCVAPRCAATRAHRSSRCSSLVCMKHVLCHVLMSFSALKGFKRTRVSYGPIPLSWGCWKLVSTIFNVYIHINLYIYIYICVYTHIYISKNTYTFLAIRAHMYIYVSAHTHVCIYIDVCIYLCIWHKSVNVLKQR